jgi:predicted component of type VI protein secretion system
VADLILEVIEGEDAGRQIELTGTVVIGREPSVTVVLDDEQVSRRHARIAVEGGWAVVKDLGSTNGTHVNEQPIAEVRQLEPGDTVRVGGTVFQLRTVQQVSEQGTAARPVPEVAAVGAEVLGSPAPRVAEQPPGFVPPEVVEDANARSDYQAIARLLDASVKRQTNVAVIALLGAAGVAVLLAFGLK